MPRTETSTENDYPRHTGKRPLASVFRRDFGDISGREDIYMEDGSIPKTLDELLKAREVQKSSSNNKKRTSSKKEENKFTLRKRIEGKGPLPGTISFRGTGEGIEDQSSSGEEGRTARDIYREEARKAFENKQRALEEENGPSTNGKYITEEQMKIPAIKERLRGDLGEDKLRVILGASTGTGKSYRLIKLCSQLATEFPGIWILLVVPLVSLVKMYESEINGDILDPSTRFHAYNKLPPSGNTEEQKLLITTVHSIHKLTLPLDPNSKILVIVDEALSVGGSIVSTEMRNMKLNTNSLYNWTKRSTVAIYCDALIFSDSFFTENMIGVRIDNIPKEDWILLSSTENNYCVKATVERIPEDWESSTIIAIQYSPPPVFTLVKNVVSRSLRALLGEIYYSIYVSGYTRLGFFTTCPNYLWKIFTILSCKTSEILLENPKGKAFKNFMKHSSTIVFRTITLYSGSDDLKLFLERGQRLGELSETDEQGRTIVWLIGWSTALVAGTSIVEPLDGVYFIVNDIGGPSYAVQGVARPRNVKSFVVNGTIIDPKPHSSDLSKNDRSQKHKNADVLEYCASVSTDPVYSSQLRKAAKGDVFSVISAAAQEGKENPLEAIIDHLECPGGVYGNIIKYHRKQRKKYSENITGSILEAFSVNDKATYGRDIPKSKREKTLVVSNYLKVSDSVLKNSDCGVCRIGNFTYYEICPVHEKIEAFLLLGVEFSSLEREKVDSRAGTYTLNGGSVSPGAYQALANLPSINNIIDCAYMLSPFAYLITKGNVYLPTHILSPFMLYTRMLGCLLGKPGVTFHNPLEKQRSYDTVNYIHYYIQLYGCIHKSIPPCKNNKILPLATEVKDLKDVVITYIERIHKPFSIKNVSKSSTNRKRYTKVKSIKNHSEGVNNTPFPFERDHDVKESCRYTLNSGIIEEGSPQGVDLLLRAFYSVYESILSKYVKSIPKSKRERVLLDEFVKLLKEYREQPSCILFKQPTEESEMILEDIKQWYTKLHLYQWEEEDI